MMKKWTQTELDAQRADLGGVLDLGTGDFRACQFYGRSRVAIGPHSILGEGVQLGEACMIGEGCTIGAGFSSRQFLHIGENCHFGEGAHIGFGSMIGAGCCFAAPCSIEDETIIREGVELPKESTVYGVGGVDGRTFFRMGPIAGRALYAFEVVNPDGTRRAWAGCTGVAPAPLNDFIKYARERAENRQLRAYSAWRDDTWERMHMAATYVYSHFAQSAS